MLESTTRQIIGQFLGTTDTLNDTIKPKSVCRQKLIALQPFLADPIQWDDRECICAKMSNNTILTISVAVPLTKGGHNSVELSDPHVEILELNCRIRISGHARLFLPVNYEG